MRGSLCLQSSTLWGTRACLSYRLGFLSIQWFENGGCRGVGIRQCGWGGSWGRCWTFGERIVWAEQPGMLLFSGFLIEDGHICIASLFLDTAAVFSLWGSFSMKIEIETGGAPSFVAGRVILELCSLQRWKEWDFSWKNL
jgi:hypothetical protein